MGVLDLPGDFATDTRPAREGAGRKPWARNATSPSADDGTRLDATLVNDLLGLVRGLLAAAGISENPGDDTQLADAVLALVPTVPPAAHTHPVAALTDGSGFVRMTDAERSKLSALVANYKGAYATLAAVAVAYPVAVAGDWAVIALVGEPASIAVWDSDTSTWVDVDGAPPATAASTPFTPHGSIGATNVQAAIQEVRDEAAAAVHTHAQSDVTGLVSDLAAKAPLASPTLTGTPAAPTAAPGTNTTQISTTAFVAAALAALSTGKLRQAVQGTLLSSTSTASTSFVDTGLSVTITPTSESSKVLILAFMSYAMTGNGMMVKLLRGSTDIIVGDAAGSRTRTTTGGHYTDEGTVAALGNLSLHYLDSPAAIVATTYKLQYRVSNNTGYINRTSADADAATSSRGACVIIALEIAA